MKRLMINSDDYGRSPDVSRGIRDAHWQGVVTSTTCMTNIPTTAGAIAVAWRETPKLGVRVHLVLAMGRPLRSREDESFIKKSIYNDQRNGEFRILTDLSIKEAMQANDIELITFAEL